MENVLKIKEMLQQFFDTIHATYDEKMEFIIYDFFNKSYETLLPKEYFFLLDQNEQVIIKPRAEYTIDDFVLKNKLNSEISFF